VKREFVQETPDQQQAAKDTVDQVRGLLQQTAGEDPHWIGAARAFVVDLTPEQLGAVAGSPLVKGIRLNRRFGSKTYQA